MPKCVIVPLRDDMEDYPMHVVLEAAIPRKYWDPGLYYRIDLTDEEYQEYSGIIAQFKIWEKRFRVHESAEHDRYHAEAIAQRKLELEQKEREEYDRLKAKFAATDV